MAGSKTPAPMSLTRSAPASRALEATLAWKVSTLMGWSGSTERTSSMAGSMRSHSVWMPTVSAPGRVLWPPMSRISAPSATIFKAVSAACCAWPMRLPSKKESGVALITPMMRGTLKSRVRPSNSKAGGVVRPNMAVVRATKERWRRKQTFDCGKMMADGGTSCEGCSRLVSKLLLL